MSREPTPILRRSARTAIHVSSAVSSIPVGIREESDDRLTLCCNETGLVPDSSSTFLTPSFDAEVVREPEDDLVAGDGIRWIQITDFDHETHPLSVTISTKAEKLTVRS